MRLPPDSATGKGQGSSLVRRQKFRVIYSGDELFISKVSFDLLGVWWLSTTFRLHRASRSVLIKIRHASWFIIQCPLKQPWNAMCMTLMPLTNPRCHTTEDRGGAFNATYLNQRAHGTSELIEGLSPSIHSYLEHKAPAR